jgi:hypothetical protein
MDRLDASIRISEEKLMSRSTEALLMSLVACSLPGLGCDPVRTTMQYVHLQVTDRASGQPVAGAEVQMKAPYGGVTPSLKSLTDEQWLDRPPNHVGLTDQHGRADVCVKITAIDHSVWPSKPRDWVSGMEYICGVTQGEARDVLRLEMRTRAAGTGKYFDVSVINIDEPQFVEK